jgi:hypothetical protein
MGLLRDSLELGGLAGLTGLVLWEFVAAYILPRIKPEADEPRSPVAGAVEDDSTDPEYSSQFLPRGSSSDDVTEMRNFSASEHLHSESHVPRVKSRYFQPNSTAAQEMQQSML